VWRFVSSGEPPPERCPGVLKMARVDARLLPVIEWDGREFLVDVGARQFRNVEDMNDVIGMHSPQGRLILEQMQSITWHVFAVDSGGPTDLTV
jgi:hypothetical protein